MPLWVYGIIYAAAFLALLYLQGLVIIIILALLQGPKGFDNVPGYRWLFKPRKDR